MPHLFLPNCIIHQIKHLTYYHSTIVFIYKTQKSLPTNKTTIILNFKIFLTKRKSSSMPNIESAHITLTDSFLKRLKDLNFQSEFLRLYIEPGGCHGITWKFSVDSKKKTQDVKISEGLVVDRFSLSMLKDSTLDYEETIESKQFVVKSTSKNSTSCSCGTSFSPPQSPQSF